MAGVCVDPDTGLTYDEFARLAVEDTPAARIRNSGSQSVPDSASFTVVIMETVEFDNSQMVFDESTLRIPSDGLYVVNFNGAFEFGADDSRLAEVQLLRAVPTAGAGFQVIRTGPDTMPASGGFGVNPRLQLFEIVELDEDDRLRVQVAQRNDAAAARDLIFSGVASAYFTVARLIPRV